MILISNLVLNISDGGTIASTAIYGDDKKTYINIGSGNVFKLFWETPTLVNDTVDRYTLVLKRHDTVIDVYHDILEKNIGLINEFYVDASMLPTVPTQYKLVVYVVAYGIKGSTSISNVVTPYISKGSGVYVKVTPAGYSQQIMKRAIAFTKASNTADIIEPVLLDVTGRKLVSQDNKTLKATHATRVLSSDTWNIVLEGYTKADGSWKANDIKYEVLVDKYGDIITDRDNKPIYVL